MSDTRESSALVCLDEERREQVRSATLNGLDYLEVSPGQLTLTVYFLGKAPAELRKENVRIEGGVQVRDIRVTGIQVNRRAQRDRDDSMMVTVDRYGDFSTYRLRLVEYDPDDPESVRPMAGFDQRYAELEFSFKADCPSDLDCGIARPCPVERAPAPDINYLARDYGALRQVILDRMAVLLPEWRERHVPDLGIALVELLAYAGDYLSQFQDAVATEAYLATARQRISVRRHARLVDYQMHEGCNARAWVTIETDRDFEIDLATARFLTRGEGTPAGYRAVTWSDLSGLPADRFETFLPLPVGGKTKITQARSEIPFYTWGNAECCLVRGATSATLLDSWRAGGDDVGARARALDDLKVGDVLILEEVIGPRTGDTADADPSRRHPVRLTRVERGVDLLPHDAPDAGGGTPVVEIAWAEADALPFPLCLSSRQPAPDCGPLRDVSVARGNVILVDHGRPVEEDLDPVPEEPPRPTCDPCQDVASETVPARFEPTLESAPVTFSEPARPTAPASRALAQDPRAALPQLRLTDAHPADGPGAGRPPEWVAVGDLLTSGPDDRHVVAEIDNEGRAHLRFGRGSLGLAAPPGRTLRARYRVGSGTRGNVGAGTILLLALERDITRGASLRVRNPLPAVGGTEPESLTEVRLLAPGAFRADRQRAVIAGDYAELVERDFADAVQDAAAELRWTGSWYEAQVAVDQRGRADAEPDLLQRIDGRLHRYRRIGHDLRVGASHAVPLAVRLHVCLQPHYERGPLLAALLDLFGNRVLPDGSLGFFHPDNLEFGEGIYLSRLVAAARRVAGVESVRVKQLERMHQPSDAALREGVLRMGPLEIAQVDNDPSFPERGSISFTFGGGR
jgi:hypothetical protein